jgi:hypothetical protein
MALAHCTDVDLPAHVKPGGFDQLEDRRPE